MNGLASPVPISPAHEIAFFDCGVEALTAYLRRYALTNHLSDSARTYVACRGARVVGFYSLAVGSVLHADAPGRVTKSQPRHPVPVMILARLAVDVSEQGTGLGKGLLKDALLRTAQAADIAGIRALLVHAKDAKVREWYMRYDFEPSPTDPLHLFLLMKDIREALRPAGNKG